MIAVARIICAGNRLGMWENSFVPNRNINISDKQERFIRHRVKQGDYSNASEVVRTALRLLERQEREDKLKLELLKRAVKEGMDEIDRGEFVVVEPDEIDGFVDTLAAKVLKRNG